MTEEEKLVVVMNLRNTNISQYMNYNFNSITVLNGQYIGANDKGIFVLNESEDDNGDKILSTIRLALTDFGIPLSKRIVSLRIAYEGDGILSFKIVTDEKEEEARYYLLTSNRKSGQKEYVLPIGRDGKGRYWSIEISNEYGADFSIDSIIAKLAVLSFKPLN